MTTPARPVKSAFMDLAELADVLGEAPKTIRNYRIPELIAGGVVFRHPPGSGRRIQVYRDTVLAYLASEKEKAINA